MPCKCLGDAGNDSVNGEGRRGKMGEKERKWRGEEMEGEKRRGEEREKRV